MKLSQNQRKGLRPALKTQQKKSKEQSGKQTKRHPYINIKKRELEE